MFQPHVKALEELRLIVNLAASGKLLESEAEPEPEPTDSASDSGVNTGFDSNLGPISPPLPRCPAPPDENRDSGAYGGPAMKPRNKIFEGCLYVRLNPKLENEILMDTKCKDELAKLRSSTETWLEHEDTKFHMRGMVDYLKESSKEPPSAHERTRALDTHSSAALHMSTEERRSHERSAIQATLQTHPLPTQQRQAAQAFQAGADDGPDADAPAPPPAPLRSAAAELTDLEAAKAKLALFAAEKVQLERALAAELAARHDDPSQLMTNAAIRQYLQSEDVGGTHDRLREYDAAAKIQASWRGVRARGEVYTFLIEREEQWERSWARQWEEAQQLKTHAEQLFQEGEEKLKQARKFAASAQTSRVAGADSDASLQKWVASRQPHPDTQRLPATRRHAAQRGAPSTSYLHASFDDTDADVDVVKKKPKPVASQKERSDRLVALSTGHHIRDAKLREKKIALDKDRAAEEAKHCIDWRTAIDASSSKNGVPKPKRSAAVRAPPSLLPVGDRLHAWGEKVRFAAQHLTLLAHFEPSVFF